MISQTRKHFEKDVRFKSVDPVRVVVGVCLPNAMLIVPAGSSGSTRRPARVSGVPAWAWWSPLCSRLAEVRCGAAAWGYWHAQSSPVCLQRGACANGAGSPGGEAQARQEAVRRGALSLGACAHRCCEWRVSWPQTCRMLRLGRRQRCLGRTGQLRPRCGVRVSSKFAVVLPRLWAPRRGLHPPGALQVGRVL